jgi:3-deoxy-D-manno-octulosonic-acid transferase
MKLALSLDLKGSLRSKSKKINSTDQVHIADTLGELGLWYELTHVSFIGGSITRNGGHNPYEAILADTFIIHGPETFNFEEIYQKLDERNFGKKIINSEQLFQEVLNLFNKDKVAICFTKAKELIASDKKKIKTLANQIHDRLKGT